MKKLNIEPKALSHLNISTIGPSTRSATEKMGLKVSVVPAKYVAESVVESLRERVQGQRVLLVRAAAARDVIPRELRKMGGTVDVVEAYEQKLRDARVALFKAQEARRAKASQLRAAAVAEARIKARAQIEQAQAAIEQDKVSAKQNLEGEAGHLATEIIRTVLAPAAGGR